MSGKLGVARTGVALAALLGGWHFVWSGLVALGLAQPLIDFIFRIHFIKPLYVIEPFAFARAVILVLITGGIGLASGSAFALIWNALHKS
jgi:hypothetical protein